MAFKFRAQAALDLRTRELHDAQRELARLEADRDAARMRLGQSEAAVSGARQTAATVMRGGTDCTSLQWYQFWILRLDHERRSAVAALATKEAALGKGIEACMRAQQKRESLDRFREKSKAGYDAAEAATERKLIDELATRRYAAIRQSVSS